MRRIKQILIKISALAVTLGLVGIGPVAQAETVAIAPSLVISQLKITASSGQMAVLYNPTNNTLDMTKYQLEYFNNYDLTRATSSRLIALSGVLPSHSYYIVSDDTQQICYSAVVSSLSMGFSSTSGYLGVVGVNQALPGSVISPALQDYVAWSKTTAQGAQTLPSQTSSSLLRQPFDTQGRPEVQTAGAGTWLQVKPDPANTCNLVTNASAPKPVPNASSGLLPSIEPPYTVVEDQDIEDSALANNGAKLPKMDEGLMAPKITELLPNPEGTGNDDSEEFIELYNPNPTSFDLSGFSLKTGITTTHNYTFPDGTTLPALSFTAFYSAKTKLSLSNTTSQARLFDPIGNMISDTDIYLSAKDGDAWILANSVWDWSITASPNMANIVHIDASKNNGTVTEGAAKSKAKDKKPSTKTTKKIVSKKTVKTKKSKKSEVLGASASSYKQEEQKTPVHAWTLALVGSLAILYATYEYRYDIANKVHELRRNYQAWRRNRQ